MQKRVKKKHGKGGLEVFKAVCCVCGIILITALLIAVFPGNQATAVFADDSAEGVTISGRIKTFNPKKSAKIQLMNDDGEVDYINTDTTSDSGQIEQSFEFQIVTPGIYSLVITKVAHTSFTVKNIVVGSEDVDLTCSDRPDVSVMTLRCGDISEDGLINDGDLTILWRKGNFDKNVGEASNQLCDLNGDEYINDGDLAILWAPYNYNKGAIVIQEPGNISKEEYLITYHISDNDAYLQSIIIENPNPAVYSKQYGLVLQDLLVDGYNFLGWYTSAIGGTKVTAILPEETGNRTLYAHWERRTFTLNFDANGGNVSPTSKTVNCGDEYGILPIPTRDYHNFLGWYTEVTGGSQVIESTVADDSTEAKTIYAHWEPKLLSDWVLIGQEPTGAQIDEQHKWSYTLTTTKTSYDTTMSGFTSISSEWIQTGTNWDRYATFPSGYDTHDQYYQDYRKSAYTASETATTKRTVSNTSDGYIYWKWMYDCGNASAGDRAIAAKSGTGYNNYNYKFFTARTSSTNYSSISTSTMGTVYPITDIWQSYAQSLGSRYWYRITRYRSTYIDYKKLFTYQKIQNNLESFTIPVPSTSEEAVSNVQEYIRYIEM